ncbi:hypothetical protein ACFOVS_22240, partial [Rhizobium lemnae]
MSYNQVFSQSKLELIFNGVADELNNLGNYVVDNLGEGTKNAGKTLQSIGGALSANGTARGAAYGELLDLTGKWLESGSTAYLEGISAETAAKIATDLGVGSLAGKALIAVVTCHCIFIRRRLEPRWFWLRQ